MKPSVYIDGKQLQRLPSGHWFSVRVEPGKHQVYSTEKFESPIVIDATLGNTTYVKTLGNTTYVKMTIDWGIPHGFGILREVDPKKAQSKIAKLERLHDDQNQ